ncbi:transmembrane protein 127 [Parasteatoda tepidariorum]|nr:transmembrane protein 127 [Parasteatoda tepidariorum]XP_042912598.1 transmembrane protein 127 [Parasteatoda tepidariorum]XP_042912605.1 transmembrane protein 127 [Parasteatoda tepidariorum]
MLSVIPANFVNQTARSSNERERNVIAAIFSAMLILLLIMALSLPNWYYLKGGGCRHQVLGAEQFLYVNPGDSGIISLNSGNISHASLAYYGLNDDMKNCLTPTIVTVQRVNIGLCFLTIFFSFCQFYFDITGVKNHVIHCTRRCAIGSIFSVISIVTIIGLCYYVSDLMEQQQELTKLYPTTRVEITFGVSYYLVATAGIIAVLATAANLFRCDHLTRSNDVSMLLDDHQEETFSIGLPHSQSWSHIHEQNAAYLNNLPPPPPYTP